MKRLFNKIVAFVFAAAAFVLMYFTIILGAVAGSVMAVTALAYGVCRLVFGRGIITNALTAAVFGGLLFLIGGKLCIAILCLVAAYVVVAMAGMFALRCKARSAYAA